MEKTVESICEEMCPSQSIGFLVTLSESNPPALDELLDDPNLPDWQNPVLQ